jgi:hypothetical protein
MEILRVPPYPIVTTWDVPEANTSYVIYIEDLVDHSFQNADVVSNATSKITYSLPKSMVQFDRKFLFKVLDSTGQTVVEDNLDIYRPYVDPKTLGTTASEILEYKTLEIVSRAIIDSVVAKGFYNKKVNVQAAGQGSDYMPLWYDVNKVLRVYENSKLVFDGEDVKLRISGFHDVEQPVTKDVGLTAVEANKYEVGNRIVISGVQEEYESLNGSFIVSEIIDEHSFRVRAKIADYSPVADENFALALRGWDVLYKVSRDNSAIVRELAGVVNRLEGRQVTVPIGRGDLVYDARNFGDFPKGWDYNFVLDVGPKAISPDIEYATKLLVEDLKCGKLEYFQRYVSAYNTDQFKIQFDKQLFGGTGNLIVDKILSRHVDTITRLGVL